MFMLVIILLYSIFKNLSPFQHIKEYLDLYYTYVNLDH